MHLHRFGETLFLVLGPAFALLGLVAVISPRLFAKVADRSSRWIDSRRVLDLFDKQWSIDHLVLRHTRAFGVLVLAALSILAYLYLMRR